MPEWVCPNCRGGFPDLDDNQCPWCGQAVGEYEPEIVNAITKVKSRESSDEPQRGLLQRWLGSG